MFLWLISLSLMPSESIHVAQSSIHVTSEQIMVSVFQRCANSRLLDPLPHLKKSHQLLCFHTLNNYLISLIFKFSLGWENLVWDYFILLESKKKSIPSFKKIAFFGMSCLQVSSFQHKNLPSVGILMEEMCVNPSYLEAN